MWQFPLQPAEGNIILQIRTGPGRRWWALSVDLLSLPLAAALSSWSYKSSARVCMVIYMSWNFSWEKQRNSFLLQIEYWWQTKEIISSKSGLWKTMICWSFLQEQEWLKWSRITEKHTPAWMMAHKSCIPATPCTTGGPLHQQVSFQQLFTVFKILWRLILSYLPGPWKLCYVPLPCIQEERFSSEEIVINTTFVNKTAPFSLGSVGVAQAGLRLTG